MTQKIQDFSIEHTFSLKNKLALVTGAAGHLGAGCAFALGKAGAHVILNGRNQERLKDIQGLLQQYQIESTVLAFDVTDLKAVQDAVKFIQKQFEQLDIIVSNAHHGRACHYEAANAADFMNDYQVNVVSAFELIKCSEQLLQKAVECHGDASIINMGSMYGMVSPDPRVYGDSLQNNPPQYGAAKAALIQLTKYMACHLAPQKIRVNAISPGPFPIEKVIKQHPEFEAGLIEKVPMKRIGLPHELQGPLLFLASSASSFVTGINLPVDGGWTAW